MKYLFLSAILLTSCSSSDNDRENEVVVQIEESVHEHELIPHEHDLVPHTHADLNSRIESIENQSAGGQVTSEEGRRIIELINNSSPWKIKQ